MSAVLDAIRSKYPDYASVPDDELALRVGTRYPQYLLNGDFEQEFEAARTRQAAQPILGEEASRIRGTSNVTSAGSRVNELAPAAVAIDALVEEASDVGRNLETPIIQIPRVESEQIGGPLPTIAKEAIAATANVAGGLVSGATSPIGVATIPAAAVRIARPVIGGVFGGLMAKSAGEQLGTASVTGDRQQMIEGALTAGLSALVTTGSKYAPETTKATVETARAIEQAAPKASEAVRPTPQAPKATAGNAAPLQELEALNQQGLLVGRLKREYESLKAQSAEANRAAAEQLQRELQQNAPKEQATPVVQQSAGVPDTLSESVRMRQSAERATTSPDIPPSVQETIKTAPESFYRQQSMARVEDAVSSMADAELGTVPLDSNLYTAAKLEQAKRLFDKGDNAAGYEVFVELEKQGTRFGQLINQFKLLKGTRPESVVEVINEGLKKAGKDTLTPEQSQRALDIASRSKQSDAALDAATDVWVKNPTPENAKIAEAALDKSNIEAVELQKFVHKYQPKSTSATLKSVLQGNLLTPISQVANVVGNMSFLPFRALDRTLASGMDVISNAVLKKPREITVQPITGTIEAAKGALRGLAKTPDIALRGTGDVVKGETRAGLHPVRAWINQFAKNPEMPLTGGKLTLKDRLNLAIEGTLGVPAEVMLRGLGIGDQPFREAARARVVAAELSLNKVPRDQWPFAQKFPELFLNKATMERVQRESLAAIFQRESKTLNLVTNWLKGKGDFVDFLAATVAPYKLTPWNIISEILSYNPIVAFTRSVYDSAKGNTRDAKLNAGKFVVGSTVAASGWWLYEKGLLAPSLDERDEAQKARVLSGEVLPPNHINLSGLRRLTAGGDPTFRAGDETVDTFRAGGLAGSIFYMVANVGREMERQPEMSQSEMWTSILRQSTLEQARFGLNQSFLSGVEGLLTAVKEGNADNYLRQWSSTVSSIPLPNSMSALSRATRDYKPDFKEDTFIKQIENMVRNRLGFAGLDDYLPLKRDLWGQPLRETPEGRNAIFYQFFDISRNKQVTDDPVELELYRLWRTTANTEVIPSLPMRTVTQDRQTYVLNPRQYERFAELVGTRRREIVDSLVINEEFYKLSDEEKISLLKRAYDKGMDVGKAEFLSEQTEPLTPKPKRAGF